MERILGLCDYVKNPFYRKAMNLPKEMIEQYEFLASGEYNVNYVFVHPGTGQKLVLRINCQSQLHLEKQISYEANALKLLEESLRTPKVLFVDDSKKYLNYGVLVMEFLPGESLDYQSKRQLHLAAEALADIHSIKASDDACELIAPKEPLKAIIEECESMLKVYLDSALASKAKKCRLRSLLDKGHEILRNCAMENVEYRIINTELNSTNFLLDMEQECCYVVDWEKPLLGDPAQDLGHFLAPTTTFWKTDIIFSKTEIDEFIKDYCALAKGRVPLDGLEKRVKEFIPITCLRGITWCAMAYIEYQAADKMIVNESTKKKLEAYLSDEYLNRIEELLNIALRKVSIE